MKYEVLTSRWQCPECSSPVRLFFEQAAGVDETDSVEFVCNRAMCELGHELPEEISREAIEYSDDEFYAAMERGGKVAEVWRAPDSDQDPGTTGL